MFPKLENSSLPGVQSRYVCHVNKWKTLWIIVMIPLSDRRQKKFILENKKHSDNNMTEKKLYCSNTMKWGLQLIDVWWMTRQQACVAPHTGPDTHAAFRSGAQQWVGHCCTVMRSTNCHRFHDLNGSVSVSKRRRVNGAICHLLCALKLAEWTGWQWLRTKPHCPVRRLQLRCA